jgi:hypothetical protein
MKILSSLILLAAVLFSLHAQGTISLDSKDAGTLAQHGFRFIKPSQVQIQTLDNAIENLTLEKKNKSQTRTIGEAVLYLWENINVAVIQTPRVCTEYRGYFWFSRLDWAKKDDETFQSGIAVKRGAGEIYRWTIPKKN